MRGNNTEIVEKVLNEYHTRECPQDEDKDAFLLAVASGSAGMVATVAGSVYHKDEGVTVDGLEQAAEVGALDMVESLWDSLPDQGSECAVGGMSVAVEVAASHGHFEVAEWCVRALHRETGLRARNVEEVMRHFCVWRSLVQWLHEEGCFARWGDRFPLMGAREGNSEWVLWCLENGWDYDDGIMESAARGGLRERGYRWTTEICDLAALSGQVELLKWCLLNGCPWSWPKVAEAGLSYCVFDKTGWDVRDWCIEVGGGEVLVDGAWVPMVVATRSLPSTG